MRDRQVTVAAVVYVAAVFLVAADITIVHVTLPTIGREFGESQSSMAAVGTVYLLSMAVFMPASGWLGDRLGARDVILGGTAVFTLASALCGAADSLPELLAARVAQGAAGGLMTPVGLGLLYRLVPVERRIRLTALMSIPQALGPAVGPALGGLLTEQLSWRWAFYVNVPVGVGVVVFGALFMLRHRQPGDQGLDLPGMLLAGAGLAAVVFAVSEAPNRGWAAPEIGISLAAGLVLLAVLVRVELRTRHPAVDVRLLSDQLFRTSTGIIAFASMAIAAYQYVSAQFLQNVLGYPPFEAGLATIPLAVGFAIGPQPTAWWIFPRLGPRRTMLIGQLLLAGCFAAMLTVEAGTSIWWLGTVFFATGLVGPMVFISAQTAAFGSITDASMGRASMFVSSQRQVFGAFGVSAAATGLAVLGPGGAAGGSGDPTAYHGVFLGCAVVVLIGMVSLRWMDDSAFP